MSKWVVLVGTDPAGQGGIATVVSKYVCGSLADSYHLRYCVSHCNAGGPKKFWYAIFAVVRLSLMLARGQVGVLHAHSASGQSFYRKSLYLALARLRGVPTIFHLHGGGFDRFVNDLRWPWAKRWVAHTLQRSSLVFTLSHSWSDFVQRLAPGARTQVVVNPVTLPAGAPGWAEEAGRVLFSGHASIAKGAWDLVTAMATLRLSHPSLRLVFAGDGDLDALGLHILRNGLQDHVEVLGWCGPTQLKQQLERAQIFALPSYREGLPMAMLEAMAFGKAVVVSAVGGIPEAVEHGVNGLLIQPGKVEDLSKAIGTLLDKPELRADLGFAARARAAERYNAERVFEQVAQVYADLGVLPRVLNSISD